MMIVACARCQWRRSAQKTPPARRGERGHSREAEGPGALSDRLIVGLVRARHAPAALQLCIFRRLAFLSPRPASDRTSSSHWGAGSPMERQELFLGEDERFWVTASFVGMFCDPVVVGERTGRGALLDNSAAVHGAMPLWRERVGTSALAASCPRFHRRRGNPGRAPGDVLCHARASLRVDRGPEVRRGPGKPFRLEVGGGGGGPARRRQRSRRSHQG